MTIKSSAGSSETSELFSSTSKRTLFLNGDDLDMWELYYYAGVTVDPKVFKVLLDLVRLNIHPKSIVEMLKEMTENSRDKDKTDTNTTGVKSASTSSTETSSNPKRTSKKSTSSALNPRRPPSTSTSRKSEAIKKPVESSRKPTRKTVT